jgi:hypothetical protein
MHWPALCKCFVERRTTLKLVLILLMVLGNEALWPVLHHVLRLRQLRGSHWYPNWRRCRERSGWPVLGTCTSNRPGVRLEQCLHGRCKGHKGWMDSQCHLLILLKRLLVNAECLTMP